MKKRALICGMLTLAGSIVPRSASAERVWIELPRAEQIEALPASLPAAPLPNARSLHRRQARGRADQVARLARGPSRSALDALRATGVRIHFVSRWLSRVSVEVDATTLPRLRAAFPAARISTVKVWRRHLPETSPLIPLRAPAKGAGLDYGESWLQNHQIQVDEMQGLGFTGNGVRILVLDTGFLRTHPAFSRLQVVAEWDFVFGDAQTANEAQDVSHQHDHGTGVLGVLAGYAPGTLIGPAYDAEFLLAKTEKLDTETRQEEDNFVAALEWGEALGADLATASVGYLDFADEPGGFGYDPADLDGNTAVTTRAMDDLVALGVVALSAVGNLGAAGPSSLITPSDADSVLAIGSARADSLVSAFSSRGPTADGRIKPDLMARGTMTTWVDASGTFAQANGTSLATPLAAGACALLLEAHPEWGPGEVQAALRSTATRAQAPDNDCGWGLLRARTASFDVSAPVYPLPFALLAPADSAQMAGATVEFRWASALDLQGAISEYRIQFSSSQDFADTLATHSAGSDSSRTLSFLPTGTFYWRVVARDPEWHQRVSAARALTLLTPTDAGAISTPRWAKLSPPQPNPFNPRVSLEFSLDRDARVVAEIFDLSGRRVRRLFAGSLAAGVHPWRWEGQDDRGRAVGSGVYFLSVRARSGPIARLEATRRLVLLR